MAHSGVETNPIAVVPFAAMYPPNAPGRLGREGPWPVAVRASPQEADRRDPDLELTHANRVALLGQLTASIAHEVAQPITGVVANAHVVLRLLSAETVNIDEIRQALTRVVRDAHRAGDVVGRIRALAKKAPARAGRLCVNEAIREALAFGQAEIVKHGVTVQTHFAEDLPPIRGDRVQLQQVMLNLIMNALEAMSAKARSPRHLRITTARDEAGDARVAVEDSGPGMDPHDLERMFDAFYTTKPDGLGMGLAICHAIIRAHGGKLWATPGAARGTVLQFTLPGRPAKPSRARRRQRIGDTMVHSSPGESCPTCQPADWPA